MRDKTINTVTISLDEYLHLIEIKKATEMDGLRVFGWKMYTSDEAIKILKDEVFKVYSEHEKALNKIRNLESKLQEL